MQENQKIQQFIESSLRKSSKVSERQSFPSWEEISKREIRYEYSPKKEGILVSFPKKVLFSVVGGALVAAASITFVFLQKDKFFESAGVAVTNVEESKPNKEISVALDVTASLVKGSVFILPEGAKDPMPLEKGYHLTSGDTIITKQQGSVDLEFENKSSMRITNNTELFIDRLYKTDESQTQKFTIKEGKILVIVTKQKKENEFVVGAGGQETHVRGTAFSVEYKSGKQLVAVREGMVVVGDLVVNASEQTSFSDGAEPSKVVKIFPKEDKELRAMLTQITLSRELKLYEEFSRLEMVRLEDGTEYRGVILGQTESHLQFQGPDGLMEIPISKVLESEKIR
ncbi:FecR family protein [Leptospira sp. 96542]|nr:FecR family protein [Leptospira sp. 96542]